MRWKLVGIAAGLVALSFAAGCGSEWSMNHDHNTVVGPYVAPPNKVIEFPYNFDNIARACVDGDGVYVGFKDHGAFVVPGDPACKNVPNAR